MIPHSASLHQTIVIKDDDTSFNQLTIKNDHETSNLAHNVPLNAMVNSQGITGEQLFHKFFKPQDYYLQMENREDVKSRFTPNNQDHLLAKALLKAINEPKNTSQSEEVDKLIAE